MCLEVMDFPKVIKEAIDFQQTKFPALFRCLGHSVGPPKPIYPLAGGTDSTDVGLAESTPHTSSSLTKARRLLTSIRIASQDWDKTKGGSSRPEFQDLS